MKYVYAYLAAALVFCALDFAWLGAVMGEYFKGQVGAIAYDKPQLVPAILFYAAFVVGIVVFAVVPAARMHSAVMAAGLGALLGLLAYGAYDLTNLATLKAWHWKLAAIDMTWGAFVTAMGAVAGYLAFDRLG